jgi:hypothetical protein
MCWRQSAFPFLSGRGSKPRPWRMKFMFCLVLKSQAGIQLDQAGTRSAGEASEIAGIDARGYRAEIGVVEEVEHAAADLQPQPLYDLKILANSCVEIPQTGQADRRGR